MRLEGLSIHHIDGTTKKVGNKPLEPGVGKYIELQTGIEIDEDVDIALNVRIAPRHRSEQCGVNDTARAKRFSVLTKDVERVLAIHGFHHSTGGPGAKADDFAAAFDRYSSPNGCRSRTRLLSRSSKTWV